MQRHAFRSVCSRTRPELEQASDALRSCIRQFSTTQLQAAENKGPGDKPSLRERSRAATTEINSLARSRSPVRTGKTPSGPTGTPKVVDVKSLPRLSFRGRGGARGGFTPRGGASGPSGAPRLSSPLRGGNRPSRGRGGFGGRGGRGGRGRGGAKRSTPRRKNEDDDKEKDRKFRGDEFARLDPDEQAFDNNMRFGIATKYSPSLTFDSLTDFAPAVPSSSTGKAATVLQNLSVLGTADHVGASQTFQVRHYATEIEQSGLRFFADVKNKDAAEEYLQNKNMPKAVEAEGGGENKTPEPIITDSEEAIRKVILERGINGQHETPKFALDPIGVSRSWHLRAETYTNKDVNSFETKLTSLLSKNAPKAGNKPAGKKQAKA